MGVSGVRLSEAEKRILFGFELARERRRLEREGFKVVTQRVIPVERYDPLTGEYKIVDARIVSVTADDKGGVRLLSQGERVPHTSPHGKRKEKLRKYRCSNGETSDGSVTEMTTVESFLHVLHHEGEHLFIDRVKAMIEGKKVIAQYVMLYTKIDPETGEIYVAGGRAITITKGKEVDLLA
ncbi:MAG: hypothetical protein J7M13_03620 [Synergistetes bacterium]|nr:hypothetical protein [Synergistota bacterium]